MAQKRFRFDKDPEIVFVNGIMLTGAHIARNGEVKEKFNGAYNMFCASRIIIAELSSGINKPEFSKLKTEERRTAATLPQVVVVRCRRSRFERKAPKRRVTTSGRFDVQRAASVAKR